MTPERDTLDSHGADPASSPRPNGMQALDAANEGSPRRSNLRGPELNRNQVFFSPHTRESPGQLNIVDQARTDE